MTFSIVARCAQSGQFGIAISSSSPAVAARCAHVRAGVGVVASQNITDPDLGPLVLDALSPGRTATRAVNLVMEGRPHGDYRQVVAIDRAGGYGVHYGSQILGIHAYSSARDCAAAGNLLAAPHIPAAMTAAFSAATGHLGERLMQALEAALAAGGEAGPVHSAGLKVADRLSWPLVDLRIDWAEDPVGMLRTAWDIYAPQMQAYVQRAEDPTRAPSFGVPGDE
jgi:uncharacterized Ntn-hydrolase superfamily protein